MEPASSLTNHGRSGANQETTIRIDKPILRINKPILRITTAPIANRTSLLQTSAPQPMGLIPLGPTDGRPLGITEEATLLGPTDGTTEPGPAEPGAAGATELGAVPTQRGSPKTPVALTSQWLMIERAKQS